MKNIIYILMACLLLPFAVYAQDVTLKNKNDAKVAYNKGIESINEKNYWVALEYLTAALDFNPEFAPAYLMRGKVNLELNKVRESIQDFSMATEQDRSLGEAFFYLGYATFDSNANQAVLDYYDAAINTGYKEPFVYYYRGLYKLVTGNFTGAILDFTYAIDIQPGYALAYHDRGTAKRLLGDFQGAIFDYRQAVNYNPDFPMAYNNMGSVKKKLGDFQGAVDDYSVAINLDSTFYLAYNNRGSARFQMGDYGGAMEDFNKVISMKEDYTLALNNLGGTMAKLNNLDEAVQMLNMAVQIDSTYGHAYLNRGFVKELLGDIEGACNDWRTAEELGITEASDYVKECQ